MKRRNFVIAALAIFAFTVGSVFASTFFAADAYVRVNASSTATIKPIGSVSNFSITQDATHQAVATVQIRDTRTNELVIRTAYQADGTTVLYSTSATATPITTVTIP